MNPGIVTDAATLPIALEPLPAEQVLEGAPRTGFAELSGAIGVWEHTPGTSTDVEADEVFVVLSGSATVSFDDPSLEQIEQHWSRGQSAANLSEVGATEPFDVLSLFAQKLGIKLFAARGKVLIQAQSDAMELVSERNMQLTSASGTVTASAQNGVVLSGGGSAYVKVQGDNVEIGGTGNLIVKLVELQKSGPAALSLPPSLASDLAVLSVAA